MKIKTVGVIGAGTMGSALAQKFAQEGFNVILADRKMEFVNKGLSGIKKMLEEGVNKKVFTQQQVDETIGRLVGTENLRDLKVCDIIIEAIFENFEAKSALFKELSEFVPEDTVLATNTSSFSVTELANSIQRPERFIGLHYFYHAAKNRLVEIIPGVKTNTETIQKAYLFSVQSGKDPIYTRDAYGFAVNRFFVPWLNEAVRLLEKNISPDVIDAVCMKAFGIGMGPFALMNATGVPIALHAQRTLEVFGPSYKTAILLEKQVESKQDWNLGAVPAFTSETEAEIKQRMLGCVFFVCSQILEEKVCTASDLNKGAKIGLKWSKGPVDLMLQYGEEEVRKLVDNYANLYHEKCPTGISNDNWQMEYVTLNKKSGHAIITIDRPEDLNALNEEVVKQLDEKFSIADSDPTITSIFITGSGKAFVAGADIKFFVKNIKNNSINNIVDFTAYGQKVFDKIDHSSKKVVALLNGMALGGGLELALCCDEIYALPKSAMAFPETGIGIYPGLGGTQRTARKIGKGLAKYLILTGKMMSAEDAHEIGLVDNIISMEEMLEIGNTGILPVYENKRNEKWNFYENLFNKYQYKNLVEGIDANGHKEEYDKIAKTLKFKAPIAMQIAEELIDKAQGPQSELNKLVEIFNTKDALLGLSSIGKKVSFIGE